MGARAQGSGFESRAHDQQVVNAHTGIAQIILISHHFY
jgi:hypothetical protein